MANIYTRVHHRKDTDESWSASNPVLLDGEVILVSIENKIRQKVGDGVNRYTDLPFLDSDIVEILEDVVSIHTTPEDAGKVLGVDENGNIALIDAPTSGGGGTWGDLRSLTWKNLKDMSSE